MTTKHAVSRKDETHPVQGEARPITNRQVTAPAIDVYERQEALVLLADLPGLTEQDVEITVENQVLTIKGQASDANEPQQDVLYQEFEPVAYERSFTLSDDVDAEKIEAVMKHGVLTLTLPKAERARPRKIQVETV